MDPTFAAFLGLLTAVPVLGPVLPYIPLVCGVAAIIDAIVPPPPEGSVWVIPRKVVHVLALNVGYSRNAVPAGAVSATVAQKAAELRQSATQTEQSAGQLTEAASGQPEARGLPGGVHMMGDKP